jgi:hypothetical protein
VYSVHDQNEFKDPLREKKNQTYFQNPRKNENDIKKSPNIFP